MLMLIGLILLVCLSSVFAGKIKSSKDYLVAGGSMPVVVVAFTMAATQFGGGALVGGIQQGAQLGFWPAMYTILGMAIACLVNSFVANRYRAFGDDVTPPDFIQRRYGYSRFMRGYHSFTFIFTVIAICASQVVSFASMATALGISYNTGVVICAAAVALFTIFSGMWGVATTDMAQLILVMIFLPIVAFLLLPDLNAIGVGMGDLFREPFFGEGKNLGTFLYTSAPTIIGSMYSYEYFMRFQAAKSPAQAKKASLTAGIILLSTAVPIGIIGACANRLFPEVAANEVLATIITMKLPRWAAYLFMAAIFAALMSTADSVLTSLSAIVSRDIYGKLIMHGKNVPEKRTILIARLTIAAGAAFAAWAAMHFTQILKMSFYFSPLTTGVMFAPMILGLFWKKASRRGAMAAILCGGITGLCHIFGLFLLFDRVLGVMLVGSAALVLFSLLFPDESHEQKLLRKA